eukprot:g5543.t1
MSEKKSSKGGKAETITRISFIGIGKCRTNQLLCSWNNVNWGPAKQDPRIPTLKRVLGAADRRLSPGQRQKIDWEGAQVFMMKEFPEGELLYLVVAMNEPDADDGGEYPERIANGLLQEVKKKYEEDLQAGRLEQVRNSPGDDGLSLRYKDFLTGLAQKFDDPMGYDKLARVQAKTTAVQQLMRGNIGHMLKQTEDLNVLDEQAAAMEQEAMEYDDAADEIKDYFWWKDVRVTLLIILILTIAVLLLCWYCGIFDLCKSKKEKKENKQPATSYLQRGGGAEMMAAQNNFLAAAEEVAGAVAEGGVGKTIRMFGMI